MLDSGLISVALDEIGLDGAKGITLDNLCSRLEQRAAPGCSAKYKVDEDMKRFLFDTLRGFAPATITIEDDKEGSIGAAVIRGSLELRRRSLNVPVNMPITEQQQKLLEAIGRAREKGVLQSSLISELKTDAKNVHYNIEQLIAYNLIEKHEDSLLRQSKLVKLKKFAFQENIESWQDKLINFVCGLLSTAHNYTLLQSDIRRKAREQKFMEYSCKRKWAWLANSVRQLPYIELIRVKSVSENAAIDGDDDGNGGSGDSCHLAWKLDPKLMPSSAKTDQPPVKEEAADEGDEAAAAAAAASAASSSAKPAMLNYEESIEQQVYRMVSERPDGILQVELSGILGIGYKLYNRIMEELEKSNLIVRVAEGVNKAMCYKLFTQENFAKKFPSESTAGSGAASAASSAAAAAAACPAPSVKSEEPSQSVASESKETDGNGEEPPPAKKACYSSQVSENESGQECANDSGNAGAEASKAKVKEPASPTKIGLTTRTRNRMASLEKIVNERRIITLHEASTLLYFIENPGESPADNAGGRKKTLDRKAVKRVGMLLAEAGAIKLAALTIMLHTGSIVSVEVFYAKDIERSSPELKEFSRRYVEEQEVDSKRKSSLSSAAQKMKREELESLPIQHVENLTRIFNSDDGNSGPSAPTVPGTARRQRIVSGTMLRTKSLFPRIKVLHIHLCKEVFGGEGMKDGAETFGAAGGLGNSYSGDSSTAISRVIGASVVSSIKGTSGGAAHDNATTTTAASASSPSEDPSIVKEEVARKPFSINSAILTMTIKDFKYVCVDSGLDGIPEEYAQDLFLKELPEAVQARILRSNSMKKVNRFLSVLARMGLIQPVSVMALSSDDATHMLVGAGSFLDSTYSPSSAKKYLFSDIASVRTYWDDLEYVSRYVIAQKDANEAATTTAAASDASKEAPSNAGESKPVKRKGKKYLRTLEGPAVIPIEGVEELMNETNWSHHTEKIDSKKRSVLYQHIPSQGQLYLSLSEAKYVARQVRIPTADLFFYQGYLIRRRMNPVENAQKERVPRHVTAFINRKRKLESSKHDASSSTSSASSASSASAAINTDILDIPVYQVPDVTDDTSSSAAAAAAASSGVLADFEILKPMRAKFSEKDDKRILKEVVSYCRRNNGGKFTNTWPPHTFDALSYELRKDPVKLEWHISRLLRRTATRNIIEAALAIGNGEIPSSSSSSTSTSSASAIKAVQELPPTMAEFDEKFVAEHKASLFSRISKDKKPSLTSAIASLSSYSGAASRDMSIAPVLSTLCMIAATPKKDYSPKDGYLALSKYAKGLIEEAQGLLIEVGAIKKKPPEVDDERHVACTEAFADGARNLGYSRKVFDSAEHYKQCAVGSEESLTIERGTDPGIVWESLLFAENGAGALTPLFSPSPSAKTVSSVAAAVAPTSPAVAPPIPRCGVLRHIISMQNSSHVNAAAAAAATATSSSDSINARSRSMYSYKAYMNDIHSHEKFCVEFGLNQVPETFAGNSDTDVVGYSDSDRSAGDDAAMEVEIASCDDALAVLRGLGTYSAAELLHCQHVVDALRAAGVAGLPESSLAECGCGCGCSGVDAVVCLQALSNLGVVVRAPDVLEVKYVLHEFASHWLLQRVPHEKAQVPLAGISPEGCKWTALQPWMFSDGSLNAKMVEAAQNRIVCLVTKNPGIEEKRLCAMLPFTQGATVELLEALAAENRIRKTTVLARFKPTLFGPGKVTPVPCYHPVLPHMFDSYLPFNDAQDDVLSSPVMQTSPAMNPDVPINDGSVGGSGDGIVGVSASEGASVVVTTVGDKKVSKSGEEMEEEEDDDEEDEEEDDGIDMGDEEDEEDEEI